MALTFNFLLPLLFVVNLMAQDGSTLIRTLFVNKDEIPYKVRLKCVHNSNSKRCSDDDFNNEIKKICDEFKMDFKFDSSTVCIKPFDEELNKKGELIEKRCKLANYLCVPKKIETEKVLKKEEK